MAHKNKDGIRESDSVVETGYFNINLHAGGTTESVGNWSAGCQVIWEEEAKIRHLTNSCKMSKI